jgi:hypothetical protein
MATTEIHPERTLRQRQIGPFGTAARIVVGGLLVGSVVQGHLARGLHPSAWVLGLLGFPVLLVGLQWPRPDLLRHLDVAGRSARRSRL